MSQQNNKNTSLLWMFVFALAIPTIPFLLIGWWLEPAIESLAKSADAMQPWQSASVIFFGLAIDIFLPVPSSALLTFAGQSLGAWQGTVVGWMGLNLSAAIGFWSSRKFGPTVLERFSSTTAVDDVQHLNQWSMWFTLIGCRPLPILAEASVLLAGTNHVSPIQFWPPILLANLIIALAYSLLGEFAARHDWFISAVIVSMVLPLIFVSFRYFWKRSQ